MKWEKITGFAPLREHKVEATNTVIGDIKFDVSLMDGSLVMSVKNEYYVLSPGELFEHFIAQVQEERGGSNDA